MREIRHRDATDCVVDHPPRRWFLRAAGLTGLVSALAPAAAALAAETPIGPKWWPSPWGDDDERGATNHMTPAKTLAAVKEIRTGEVHGLGRIYEAGMPLFGSRVFAMRSPGAPTGGTFGNNRIIWNDEFLCTEIGQVGTQFDGLGHIGVEVGKVGDQTRRRFYNGFTMDEMASPYGLKKLGVEKLKPFFTRGVLIDLVTAKGRSLVAGEEVMAADLKAALTKQGLSADAITPGDAVFLHTGWGALWMKDNDKYNGGEPGIGLDAARWLAAKKVSLVGADTWGVDVVPNPDKNLAFPAHQELLTRNGIFLHENLTFDGLLAVKRHTFAYVYAPLPIKGATGSPGNPLAVT